MLETTEGNCERSSFEVLKKIRTNNAHRFVLGHVNINSIRNKFNLFSSMIKNNIRILMVKQIKPDSSFP